GGARGRRRRCPGGGAAGRHRADAAPAHGPAEAVADDRHVAAVPSGRRLGKVRRTRERHRSLRATRSCVADGSRRVRLPLRARDAISHARIELTPSRRGPSGILQQGDFAEGGLQCHNHLHARSPRARLRPFLSQTHKHFLSRIHSMTIIDTNRNVAAHLAHLKARGVTTIGRYYATSAAKRLTKPEAAAICAAGLDIFVVFEDSGDPQLSVEQGVHDAQIALGQAQAVGQPAGSAIYFALEHEKQGGFTQAHVPGIKRYMDGVRQVLAPTYKIGVYGDGVVCKALLDAQMVDFTWLSASRKHPGTPEFTASGRATLIQRTPVDQNID